MPSGIHNLIIHTQILQIWINTLMMTMMIAQDNLLDMRGGGEEGVQKEAASLQEDRVGSGTGDRWSNIATEQAKLQVVILDQFKDCWTCTGDS